MRVWGNNRPLLTPVRRVCAVVLVSVALLAGCKVDARVDITLHADGSGTVVARVDLDADAARRVAAGGIPLDDVRAAGWKVSVRDGSRYTLTHEFVGQADLERRLTDLVGRTGVLRDARITHSRGWSGSKDAIEVNVDLTHLSTGIRSDAAVVKRLEAAGVDVNALDAQLRGQLGKALTVTVVVHAPGGQSHRVELTAGGEGTAAASTSYTRMRRVVLFVVGGLLLLFALVLTAVSLATRSRRRRAS